MQLLTLGTMTRPLLVCLGLMPRALFAGKLTNASARLSYLQDADASSAFFL